MNCARVTLKTDKKWDPVGDLRLISNPFHHLQPEPIYQKKTWALSAEWMLGCFRANKKS